MARRTSEQRIARHNKIARAVKIGAVGATAVGAIGVGFGPWINGSGSGEETPRAVASSTPPPRQGEAFPSDESTFDIGSTPEPQRSSGDDIDDKPTDGWTSDPPKKSPSPSPSKSAETDKTDPCHWNTRQIQRGGKKVVLASVAIYDECVDGDMNDAATAYEKPSIESTRAFHLSNAMEVELGCQVDGSDWYLVRSNGIAGDNRAFVQGNVIGHPDTEVCPADYQDVANGDTAR